jgi:hypothetical protein
MLSKKAGGRYAADLLLRLPAPDKSGSVAIPYVKPALDWLTRRKQAYPIDCGNL